MPGRLGKSIGSLFAAAFVALITILPHRPAYLAARGAVRLVVFFIPRLRKTGRRNLERVFPELEPVQREEILDASLNVFASNMLHLARIRKMDREYLRAQSNIEQIVPLYQATRRISGEKGLLFISAHFGDFEMLMPFKGYFCGGGVGVARPFGMPLLDRIWNARREVSASRILSRGGAFREVLAAIRQGSDACMLFDQNVKRNHAVFSNLFGIPAATAGSAALAALRSDVPILFATVKTITPLDREPKFHFHLEHIPTDDLKNIESTEEKVREITDRLHAALEKQIRIDPKQWFWIHRRFKTRPAGEPETFYD